ncbi:zinc transport system permease protein [Chitinivorax tropicus]|uniref:Zinc transport system permease protein n=1 Tax=Chitinivorax tropicus TaxID=714531 RepID=A0A840MJU0_9PROT|nr:metal ABC transporter permease [Chitinivorax tropicus]MBB5018670.1 zinc transport system permease protein [Chitinivorax tropicus]
MAGFIDALLHQSFMQYALLGGLLASICCGLVGSYVVVKRISYLAGGISHTILGGMGIAYFFGSHPINGALVAALAAALLIGWINLQLKQHEDTLIGALWSIGMAVGVIFVAKTPGYSVDLMSYLFGNILMISPQDLWLMAALDAIVILLVWLFREQFLAVCFDEEFARLRGIPVTFYYLLLLCMVAVTVVVLIQVVGLILVIALLTLPAAIASQWVRTLSKIMLLATLLGGLFTLGGLAISYEPDLPSGATIILLAGLSYIASLLINQLRRVKRKTP